jgi:hypothetical protein
MQCTLADDLGAVDNGPIHQIDKLQLKSDSPNFHRAVVGDGRQLRHRMPSHVSRTCNFNFDAYMCANHHLIPKATRTKPG